VLLLIFSREQGVACEQLVQDAAKGPHVYRSVVWNAEHNLRGSVEATLDVGVDFLIFEATRAKIYNFDS